MFRNIIFVLMYHGHKLLDLNTDFLFIQYLVLTYGKFRYHYLAANSSRKCDICLL
jgi:hypothetical protein